MYHGGHGWFGRCITLSVLVAVMNRAGFLLVFFRIDFSQNSFVDKQIRLG